ncbi:MAG: murein biosynthesis integral membrane protein MurJ [Solirubrobacterales bacterium]|nr:murein biosynthesis integral membrane protein MurJ [Solirubrobacterales bacterium]
MTMSTTNLPAGSPPEASSPTPPRRRIAMNTVIFAISTGLSRIAGLGREIVAASFFGTSAAASAFTIAAQVPNLMANLFSQAALSAAFVPVFTELLHEGRKRDAFGLASALFWIITFALGAVTVLWMFAAGHIVPLLTGDFHQATIDLTVGLSRVLFPVVLLLSLTGLLVGILQAYDEFSVAALAPAVWNLVILVLLVVLHSRFHGHDALYAYAVAWLVATVVQLLMVASALRRVDFHLAIRVNWRDPRIRQVLILFLPVTISIGIINLDGFLNAVFGALVSNEAPRAIDNAFRIYMLPQGVFSVAVSTVLFPALSRFVVRREPAGMRRALGNGMRQINLLMIPSAAILLVLATPIVRLVYQRGAFNGHSTQLVSTALFWYAFSLPFAGVNILLSRALFALRRPWIATRLAAINMTVDVIVSVGLYKPLGISGLVIGTATANAVMTALQLRRLRAGFGGRLEGAQTLMITIRIVIASAIMAAFAWGLWTVIDRIVGGSLAGQIVSLGVSITLACALYARIVLAMRIPEARQIKAFVASRLSPERGKATIGM